jgi:hypothetical protein
VIHLGGEVVNRFQLMLGFLTIVKRPQLLPAVPVRALHVDVTIGAVHAIAPRR